MLRSVIFVKFKFRKLDLYIYFKKFNEVQTCLTFI